jgi:multidrug resistance efflux pump
VGWEVAEAEARVAGAKATARVARSDLDGHTGAARLAGVVVRLGARPGQAGRPGAAVWGEVVDLAELVARCLVPAGDAGCLRPGQAGAVELDGGGSRFEGRVRLVGRVADAAGLLPVLVRVANPGGRLPCHAPVTAHFGGGTAPQAGAER